MSSERSSPGETPVACNWCVPRKCTIEQPAITVVELQTPQRTLFGNASISLACHGYLVTGCRYRIYQIIRSTVGLVGRGNDRGWPKSTGTSGEPNFMLTPVQTLYSCNMSDDFCSKLRFHFRLARGSAQVAARLEETSKVTRKRSNPRPQDGDKPRKTVEHLARGENPQSFSTQGQTSHVGDSYVLSGSAARTGGTTDPGSFHGQVTYSRPALPTAYESGPCSLSGDLEERLCIAYRHIRSLPPSSISPNNTRLPTDDNPRACKQLRMPHHSAINQPMPNVPLLPNPHATHARSRSRPIPSSFPHKSRPASWTHEALRSTPPIRHAKPQAQSPNRHHRPQSLPQCSLQMDTNFHLNDHPTTSLIFHPSQSMILQPVLAAPVHTGIGGPLIPRQGIDTEPLLQKKMSKLIKKRHSATLSATTASQLSYHTAAEKASVSSNQVLNSNEDIYIQDHLPVVRPPSPLQLDIVGLSTYSVL